MSYDYFQVRNLNSLEGVLKTASTIEIILFTGVNVNIYAKNHVFS